MHHISDVNFFDLILQRWRWEAKPWESKKDRFNPKGILPWRLECSPFRKLS